MQKTASFVSLYDVIDHAHPQINLNRVVFQQQRYTQMHSSSWYFNNVKINMQTKTREKLYFLFQVEMVNSSKSYKYQQFLRYYLDFFE